VRRFTLLVAGALSVGCHEDPQGPPPPACQVISPPVDGGSEPANDAGVVWGFADLHAHPAIERAFGSRLVWGEAIDDVAVNASELPMIQSCPVETHDRNASSPLDHEVGSIAFPLVAKVASFAHAPVGDLAFRPSKAWPNARDVIHQQMKVDSIRRAYEGGLRLMFASTTDDQMVATLLAGPSFVNAFVPDRTADFNSARRQLELIEAIVERNEGWMGIARSPNDARNLIGAGKLAIVMSLEMNGLTEDQLDTLVDDYGVRHIVPIHLIDNDVGGTAASSAIFNTSSAEASEIYRTDEKPLAFMDLAPSVDVSRALGWPMQIVSFDVPVYVAVSPIGYPSYASYGYESLPFCDGASAASGSFLELGQSNFRGLCTMRDECAKGLRPGALRIAHMMQRQLFVDVSHMSYRSVADTLKVTPESTQDGADGGGCGLSAPATAPTYPLIASHGDIAHLCDSQTAPPGCHDATVPSNPLTPSTVTERSLAADQARAIVARHGVLGLGTGVGAYLARRVFDARGGPLLTFDLSQGSASGCTAIAPANGTPASCRPPIAALVADANATAAVQTVDVKTVGGFSLDASNPRNAQPFVRVELLGSRGDQYQHRIIEVPLDCSSQACSGSVYLCAQSPPITLQQACDGSETPVVASAMAGGPVSSEAMTAPGGCDGPAYTVDHIEQVSLEMRNIAAGDFTCEQPPSDPSHQVAAPEWTIQNAIVTATGAQVSVPLAIVGQGDGPAAAHVDMHRGSFSLYQREDRPGLYDHVPASGHLLRVLLESGTESVLAGASTTEGGANVCVAVRALVDGVCNPNPPPAPGAVECPSGWVPVNQRGQWAISTSLYTFVRSPQAVDQICGVDVAVLDAAPSSPPWSVDEVRIEAIEDPVAHFVQRYADISRDVAESQMGTVAFGTDFNGLNGMMDISENGVPDSALTASSCLVVGPDAGPLPPQPLAPMRFRHADGTLGDQVRIDERGLATYGQLADLMAIIHDEPACGADVYDSLMLSAEATIRAWETMLGQPARPPLPTRPFCPDAGLDP
jgi:microsomal dipeptidase-like Zn-dependent dipeptidase